jgi:hypothetical protein
MRTLDLNTLHRYFPVTEHDKAGDAYAIEYVGQIDKVGFERYNAAAGVMEEVLVPWQQAFRWADADPCGGNAVAVYMKNGERFYTTSRWANPEYPNAPIGSDGQRKYGLISIGLDGWPVLRRTFDISPELSEMFHGRRRYNVQAIPAARKAAGLEV